MSERDDTLPGRVDLILARMRVELFSAAQLLKGPQLAQLRELVRDVAQVLDFDIKEHVPDSSTPVQTELPGPGEGSK